MIKSDIEKYIRENGELVTTPSGNSMWPMLRHKRDSVYFVKKNGRLEKYDLPIYKRVDGQLVMHRVVEVNENDYTMCGDNQYIVEKGIKEEQIIAVAKGFYRDEKYISCDNKWYIRYYKFWCKSLLIRRLILVPVHLVIKIKNKMGKLLH